MSTTISHTTYSSQRERAKAIAAEIKRTKLVKLGNEVFPVNDVVVFEKRGMISGWDIKFGGDAGVFSYIIEDYEDTTHVTIVMNEPGVVVAVGRHPKHGSWATVVYRD